ncbi:hypothetical protein [Parendozoicomonas sp. Alg238-R29]|uniref:hypothetical protein n=1 Tax=Parendozoicomonas sp. Alg238-R29 TaxID=2993446 RepID=UPI00248DAB11|nr:hypothetical protein [Parendozoicomonas sp. Alg238-R29]
MKKTVLTLFGVILFMGAASVFGESLRLRALNKDPFKIDCNYDVYFSNDNNSSLIKATANYVAPGYMVFNYYNTLRVKHEAYQDYNGTVLPKPGNRLPYKTYLISYLKKSIAYPYSVTKTVDKKETGLAVWDGYSLDGAYGEDNNYLKPGSVYLAPAALDTMNDIAVSHIVQRCEEINTQE